MGNFRLFVMYYAVCKIVILFFTLVFHFKFTSHCYFSLFEFYYTHVDIFLAFVYVFSTISLHGCGASGAYALGPEEEQNRYVLLLCI